MTTDLLFAPALPRKLPSSAQCDRVQTLNASSAPKKDVPGLSKDNEPDTFLTTLKRVAQDQKPTHDSQQPNSKGEVNAAKDGLPTNIDRTADRHSSGEEILAELMSFLPGDKTSSTDQSPVSAELSELMALLEVGYHRLLTQGLQRDLRLQRRVNLPSRLRHLPLRAISFGADFQPSDRSKIRGHFSTAAAPSARSPIAA